jgi:hypothetical protein
MPDFWVVPDVMVMPVAATPVAAITEGAANTFRAQG